MTDISQEHAADFLKAMAAMEKAAMQLIIDELAGLMPGLEAAEDQAAAAVREACTAVGKPERRLAGIDEEIARVAGQAAEWQGKLSSLRAEDRIEARRSLPACNEELAELREKRARAALDLQPYYDARTKARADLELAQNAKRGLAYAMLAPYESAVAQGTRAYIACRQPRLSHVLLSGDRDHPEWECAVAQLEEMCLRSAYRTDHLPGNAEQAARAMTAEMADASATIDPGPNAAEVVAQFGAEVANMALQKSVSRIDDYRTRPAPPRNEVVESYRQVPTLRDMGLR